jgi:hypothetical protein
LPTRTANDGNGMVTKESRVRGGVRTAVFWSSPTMADLVFAVDVVILLVSVSVRVDFTLSCSFFVCVLLIQGSW